MHRAEKGPSECGWKRGTGRQQQKNAGEGGKGLPITGQLHGRRFCGCGILTNPLGSTTRDCNLLILYKESWVENPVPNQLLPLIETY